MEDEYTLGEWHEYKSIVFYIPSEISDFYPDYEKNISGKSKKKMGVKLAGFDMDGTLINSSKGNAFALTANDWIFAYENIPEKMKEYKDAGYCLTIISNRKAKIDSKIVKETQKRVENLFKKLGFECFAFLLTGENEYRKPGTKVLEVLMEIAYFDFFDKDSFYCGDAAEGHSDNPWYQWSDSDYMLVRNWNRQHKEEGKLEFHTPDQIFDEFPEWETQVSPKIKLVITCGQLNSGYPEEDDEYEFNNKREFHVGRPSSFGKNPSLSDDYVTVVRGSNPTFDQREEIREKFKAKKSEVLIVWFARPSTEKLSKAIETGYSKAFQSPDSTGENWIRGN